MEDQIQSNMSRSQHSSADVVPPRYGAVILSSSDTLSNPQFTEYQNETTISHWQDTGDVGKSVLMGDSNLSSEQFFRLYEQAGPEKTRRNEKYNMRKSLAWDAAFFTCEGVLDPDELSGMIERDNKFGKHLLPEITEDICRSTDSISSLGSDSLAMESIEADLMRDIRASIQKSCQVDETTGFRKTASALGKADTAPKDLAKIKSGTKKHNTSVPGLGRLTKKSADCSQGAQIAPKVMGRRNPTTSVSMERVTSSGNQVKMGQGGRRANSSTVPGKIAPTTKTGLCGSRGTALKPPLCMKSSSINSSVTSKKDPQKHCVSSHSSSGASSTNVGLSTRRTALKPPLCMKSSSFSSSVTRKKDQQKRSVSSDSSSGASTTNVGKSLAKPKITPRVVTPTSSCSMTKLPAKVALKAKSLTSLSASSASSVRSNISPGSSVSDWSSVASSSASTVIRRSASRTTDIRPPNRTRDNNVPLAAGRSKQSNDHRNEKKASEPSDGKVKAASSQVGLLSGSATTKPSGLRIPSPNMGYFDGAKSVVHTPKRSPRSFSVIPASPKNGLGIHNISGSSSKTNAPSTSKMNASSRKPASPKPASSSASSISRRTRSRLNVSPQVKSVESVENCLKEEEIGPISAKPDPKGTDEFGITAILERERNLQKQGDINLENAKIDFIEGDASIRPVCNHVEEVKPIRAKTDVEGDAVTESTGVPESKLKSPELVDAKIDCIEGDTCPLGSICNPEHVKEVGPVGDKPDTDAAEGTTGIGVVESELVLQKGGDINRKDTHIDCIAGDTHSFVSISNAEHVKEIGCVVSKRDTDGDDETGNTDAAEGVKDVGVGESELGSQKEGDVKRKDSSIDCISGDTYSFGSSSNAEHVKEIGCVRAKSDTDGAEESGNSGLLESEMNSHTQGVVISEVGPVSKPDNDDAEGSVHVGVLESELSLQKEGDVNRKDANVDFIAGDTCSVGSISNAVHVKEIGCVRAKLDTDDAEETGNTDLLESEMNSHLKEVGSIGANPDPMEAEEAGNKGVPDHETKLQIVINLEDAEHLRISAEMDKLQELQYPKNSLNNVGENEKENMYDGGQVDTLSIPAERKEPKQGSGAELVQNYVSQTDFGHQGSDLNEGSQGNLSCASPFSHFSATKETGMGSRTPLTDMNSLCNNEEGFDPPATMNSKAVKKTVTFPLLERTVAENT